MTDDNPYLYALTADPGKPLREAKELVARLAAERDCLTAERDRLTAERDRLLAERDAALLLFRTQQMSYVSDVQRLVNERDAAQREVCYASTDPPREHAQSRGWTCFMEELK